MHTLFARCPNPPLFLPKPAFIHAGKRYGRIPIFNGKFSGLFTDSRPPGTPRFHPVNQ
jgi:hypothetical protein